MKLLNCYYLLRRKLLKVFIPEFFWSKHILLDSVKIKIRKMPYSFGTKWELQRGLYEINERELIKGRIAKGETVFEFGGSIGILTLILHS